jgi:valyl-tRNA synthetase
LRNDPDTCPDCKSKNLEQDPDVLDTWFSSWLWPFSTLGWENSDTDSSELSADLKRYYPTTALITGHDIIFFWVARMIMAGLEFTGKAPFRDIYLHGLVRDKQGRKMSKSLGNGIDPLELVDEFGSDSMKFTLAFMCAQGHDVLVDKESFKMGSKFANKIWNASRYILMNLEGRKIIDNPQLIAADKWIYSKLNNASKSIKEAFLSYRFNDAAQTAYEFFWNDFCDWYVEATKLSIKDTDNSSLPENERDRATTVLLDVLIKSLKLLHPLLPFITEEIYQNIYSQVSDTGTWLSQQLEKKLLINSRYPEYDDKFNFPEEEKNFASLMSLVGMVRTLRSECNITPDKKLRVKIQCTEEQEKNFLQYEELIKLLSGIGELNITLLCEQPYTPDTGSGSIGMVGHGFEVFVFIGEVVDLSALKKKFANDLEKDRKYIENLQTKLTNEQFIKNAPAQLVAEQKAKLDEAIKRTEKFQNYYNSLFTGSLWGISNDE